MMISNALQITEKQSDIEKAIRLLSTNGMEAAARQLSDSCKAIDALQESITTMEQLKTELENYMNTNEKQAALIKDQSETLQQMQSQLDRYNHSIFHRINDRIGALKSGLSNVKNGLIQSASDLVMNYRMKGKEALAGARELFNVEGKLTWMKQCAENGAYELDKACKKEMRISIEYQEAVDKLAGINQMEGRSHSFTKMTMENNRDNHMGVASVYEKLSSVLTKMASHLEKSIEHNREAIKSVRDIAPVEPQMNNDLEVLELG